MSTYTDYDTVSKTYDEGRIADGVDIMTMTLAGLLNKKPEEIHMLEAGCGTGNFSAAFLKHGIGKVTMIDASKGMLERAKEKVHDYLSHVVEVRQVILPNIPFEDESFDVVTFIQVVHHLDNHDLNQDLTYPVISKAFQEAYRVLKPGGVLLVDHTFKENLHNSPLALAPKALELAYLVWLDENALLKIIREANFENTFFTVRPNSSFFSPEIADNLDLVLNEKWRSIDSIWKMVEKTGELEPLLKKLNKMKEDGKLEQFAHEFYKGKRSSGEHNCIFAIKPLN